MMPMGSMMGSSGGWDMGFGGIFMLLPWVVLVTAVVAVIRWLSPTTGTAYSSGGGDRALEIHAPPAGRRSEGAGDAVARGNAGAELGAGRT